MQTNPPRGFAAEEYRARLAAARELMAAENMDAVLLTAAADIQYFSGFQTRFWQSPTRPWFLALPQNGAPVAVIPEIGRGLMQTTCITSIQCWPSPRPSDEGISLLAELLGGMKKIGMALGAESAQRMPVLDWLKLRQTLSGEIADCAGMLRQLRMVKSPREIAKIRRAAQIVSAAFAELPKFAKGAKTSREVCARLQAEILLNGADEVPYLAAASGRGGYATVIAPPDDKPIAAGEVLFIDVGAVFDGYFCDFNRNFVFGKPDAAAQTAHAILQNAARAGIAAARPGNTAADIWRAMRAKIPAAGNIGRMGHGVGLQLTEPPSISETDETKLRPGMVLAVEPSMQTENGVFVYEENIAVGETGAELLSAPEGENLPVVG